MKWKDPDTFTLQFGNNTTIELSYEATAQDVQDALNALPLMKSRVAKTTDGFHIDFMAEEPEWQGISTITMVQ